MEEPEKSAATDGSYEVEEGQMLWKGMTGRSWSKLVQQRGVPVVESLQLQKVIATMKVSQQGWRGRARCCQRRMRACWRLLRKLGG